MPESTIKPNRITIRKINQDHVYLYVRTNAKKTSRENMDGGKETLYRYDEEQIRMPSPETGLEYPSASDHAFDQTELKKRVSETIKYKDLVGKQETVDRKDEVKKMGAALVLTDSLASPQETFEIQFRRNM